MNCEKPFIKKGQAFSCGGCLPCKIIKARIWQSRLMLEAKDHESSVFVTLTYDDEELPPNGSLDPDECRNFLKRLRAAMEPTKIRYFLVGEYGEETKRPHYHAALFGFPYCSFGRSQYSKSRKQCCYSCDLIKSAWGHGNIYSGDITAHSAAYIAGYTTKKLHASEEKHAGLVPTFTRMSRRPGIGANLMFDIADSLLSLSDNQGRYPGDDVPTELRSGKAHYPLGRFLRRKLRTYIGRSPNAPQKTLDKMEAQLRPLRDLAYSYAPPGAKAFTFQQALISASAGRRANISARYRLHQKRGSQ